MFIRTVFSFSFLALGRSDILTTRPATGIKVIVIARVTILLFVISATDGTRRAEVRAWTTYVFHVVVHLVMVVMHVVVVEAGWKVFLRG